MLEQRDPKPNHLWVENKFLSLKKKKHIPYGIVNYVSLPLLVHLASPFSKLWHKLNHGMLSLKIETKEPLPSDFCEHPELLNNRAKPAVALGDVKLVKHLSLSQVFKIVLLSYRGDGLGQITSHLIIWTLSHLRHLRLNPHQAFQSQRQGESDQSPGFQAPKGGPNCKK